MVANKSPFWATSADEPFALPLSISSTQAIAIVRDGAIVSNAPD